MSVQEEALRLHACGYNCAQSVLAALGSYTGLDEKTALAAAGGLGGGVRCGEICGAVTGAVMALGLVYPYSDGEDAQARARISKLTMVLTRDFRETFGSSIHISDVYAEERQMCAVREKMLAILLNIGYPKAISYT